MYTISKYEEGICLNPKEYVLDDNGEVILFNTEQEALDFLNENGDSEVEIKDSAEAYEEYGVDIDLEENENE